MSCRRCFTPLFLLFLAFAATPALAEIEFPDERNEPKLPSTFEEPEPWREQGSELPPLPEDGDLLEVKPMDSDPYFHYWVDAASLSIGADEVIRYTMVITSNLGPARNLRFEGMLCGANEYRTYAHGTPDGAWRTVRNSSWESFTADSSDRIRWDLKRYFFCKDGMGKPLPRNQILQNLRRGGNADQGTRWFFD